MKLRFTTSCAFDDRSLCASFGFSDAANPEQKSERTFSKDVSCKLFCGSLENVLKQTESESADAAIILFGNCGGENAFVRRFSESHDCPIVGGAAAINPVTGEKGLIYGREEVCAVLINDARYRFCAVTQNIHSEIEGAHTLTFNGRFIETIDGEDAFAWYCEKRKMYGLDDGDFEHLTFSDKRGVNAHLSIVDGKLYSGRDLDATMLLRFAPPQTVFEKMQLFYSGEDAIVFGCAGLKGILPKPLSVAGCGLYMFGEVCTTDSGAEFGNLMLSKLLVKKA